MGVVGRLDQYASMLAAEFDDYSMSENLIINSEFGYSQLSGNTVATANQLFVPYGRSTAVNFVNNGGAGNTYIYQSFNTSFALGTQYVISIFSNTSTLSLDQGGISTGNYTLLNSGSISLSNNWWRHWRLYSAIVNNPIITPQVTIFPGNNITLSGWQLELGSSITDYTPTTTTAINRVLASTTNTNITGLGTYYSSGFDENVGFTTFLPANVFPPYDPVYDEFGGTLFGAGQGRYMRQYTDKSVIVYNEIDEVTDLFGRGIVRDGLVLDLDAGVRDSYPGSGTTWNDLSVYGNNGTLTNGPTYSSSNGGSIVFDGVDDYALVSSNASIPYTSSARTVNIWFYTNSTSWANNVNNLFFYGTGSVGQAFGIDMNTYPQMEVFTWGGVGRDLTFNTTYSQVGWKNICVTYNGSTTILIYENGVFTQTLTLTSACNTLSSGVYIGAINPSVLAGGYYDGRIAQTQIYNRALTASEITQNYNALKHRFGL